MISRKLTSKEIKYSLKELKKSGYSGNEKGYSIISQTKHKNKLRQEDELEVLEYDLELQNLIVSNCSNKRPKKQGENVYFDLFLSLMIILNISIHILVKMNLKN